MLVLSSKRENERDRKRENDGEMKRNWEKERM